MEDKKILLERRRPSKYTVAHESLRGGKIVFEGAKKGKPTRKEVSEELFEYLNNSTTCFKKGKLFIVDKEIREEVGEESQENNTHTQEEVIQILTSNTNSMKKKLSEITEKSEKDFVLEMAIKLHEENKFDSSTKRNFLVEWAGIKKELVAEIFPEE